MCSWENSRLSFYEDCKLATSRFFRGFEPFLFSFVASSLVFDVFWFSFHWILILIAFNKKWNAVPMQTGVIFFVQAKTNYIIAKHLYMRQIAFSIVHDHLFLFLVVMRGLSGCKITCFSYITETKIFCSGTQL